MSSLETAEPTSDRPTPDRPARMPSTRHRLAHTRTAMAHSCAPSTWRASLHMRPKSRGIEPAIRLGIASSLALIVGGALGHPDLAALAALGAIVAAFASGEPHGRRAGKVAIAGVFVLAAVALGGLLASASPAVLIAALSGAAGVAVWVLASMQILGPGAVVIVFAGSAAAVTGNLPQALLATALGVAAGWLVAVAPVAQIRATQKTPWLREGFAHMWSKEMIGAGTRILIAAALAGWAAMAIGLEHPLWATMGATAAMQSVTFASTIERAIQRLLGNVSGAAVAIALISLGLGFWPTVIIIIALQVFTEIYVTRNYALATTAITPMALLMMSLAGTMTAEMALSRVVDTGIGVLFGVIVAVLTISVADRHHLPQA